MFKNLWTKFKGNIPARNKQVQNIEYDANIIISKCDNLLYNANMIINKCDNLLYAIQDAFDNYYFSNEFCSFWHKNLQSMIDIDQKSVINIAYITDNNYAWQTAVSISSLIYNRNKHTKYNIFILYESLDENNINLYKIFGDSVHLIKTENKYKDIHYEHPYVSKTALLKFLLPTIFNNIEKLIYLDSDLIISGDISELFNENLTNVYAACVKDVPAICRLDHVALQNNSYFNSGVMLLNLSKMRDENISQKLFMIKKNPPYKEKYQDQNAFNYIFKDCVKFVSAKYNLLYSNKNAADDETCAKIYGITIQEYQKIYEKPKILHFAGGLKPWNSKNCPRFFEYHKEELIFKAANFLK